MKRPSLVALLAVLCAACGGSGGSGGSSGTTVTVSGALSSGTIAAVSLQAAAPIAGSRVVAVDNASNKTYVAQTDASGNFSIDVPANTQLLMGLINSGAYDGPVVFGGSGTEVNTVIKPTANVDLGSIVRDAAKGYARTETTPSIVETSVVAEATDGVPKGADNDGKTQNAGITNRTDSDKDQDGIPNLFDADEDNDGIRNGVASRASGESVVSDVIDRVYMSSNIWKEHGSATTGSSQAEIAANEIALRLHVVPKAGQESRVASVSCTAVPAAIAGVATVRWAASLGNPSGYPAENSLWSAASYGLYRTTDTSQFPQEEWIVSIKPVGVMSVGDTFTIRATYTDATSEDFFVTVPYVLSDWAKISTYNGTALTAAVGTKTAPVGFANDNLTIVFTKPLDEDGNVLEGLSYSVRYGVSDCGSGTCSVPATVTETAVTDVAGQATLTEIVPTATMATYYVTPVAEASGGQRNGEETWFTRQ